MSGFNTRTTLKRIGSLSLMAIAMIASGRSFSQVTGVISRPDSSIASQSATTTAAAEANISGTATLSTVQYSSSTYETASNAGAVVITLERVGSSTGAVRVGLNTHAGTALNGLDFDGIDQWVTWASGDAAPKTVSIKILNRGSFSGTRSFSLGLSGESGASLGSPATAEVDISGTSVGGGTGSATLTWTPPTENTNGTALTDLSGYVIYYGTSAGSMTQQITVSNASATTYVVPNLTTGTWYFAILAVSTSGVESSLSSTASKTI